MLLGWGLGRLYTTVLWKIWVAITEEEYATQEMGDGATAKHWQVDCEFCGISFAAKSLWSHLETQHNIYWLFVLNQDLVPECTAVIYHAMESLVTVIYFFPVPQCGSCSSTRFILHQHFLMWHSQDLVCIPIKGSLTLPWCKWCLLQIPLENLSRGHHQTGLYQRGQERKWQHEAAVHSQQALKHTFCANREDLEWVEVFKYLGQLILYNDADNQAMWSNLQKAIRCWAWDSWVLQAKNTIPKTFGMFYKPTIQAVLLYGSEIWSLSQSSMKHLEGFHILAMWRMSDKRPEWNVNGS